MTIVRMSQEDMENLSTCKDCRHFHRYRLRSMICCSDEDLRDVEVESRERILYRCLVGKAFSPELEDNVVVDCNQFEKRESKRKL